MPWTNDVRADRWIIGNERHEIFQSCESVHIYQEPAIYQIHNNIKNPGRDYWPVAQATGEGIVAAGHNTGAGSRAASDLREASAANPAPMPLTSPPRAYSHFHLLSFIGIMPFGGRLAIL